MLNLFRKKGAGTTVSRSNGGATEDLIPVSDEFAKSMAAVYNLGSVRERLVPAGSKPVVATIDGWSWSPNGHGKASR